MCVCARMCTCVGRHVIMYICVSLVVIHGGVRSLLYHSLLCLLKARSLPEAEAHNSSTPAVQQDPQTTCLIPVSIGVKGL